MSHSLLRYTLPLLGLIVASPLASAQYAPGAERLHAQPRTSWSESSGTGAAALHRAARDANVLARPHFTAGEAVEGVLRQVLIPIHFADEEVRFSPAALEERFYGTADDSYSVRRFFEEASNGRFQVEGKTLGAVRVAGSSADYVGSRSASVLNGVGDRVPELIIEALAQADAATDWSAHLEPGSDRISAVVFVTAGRGGSCSGDKTHVWPHRYNISALLGEPFRTRSQTPDGRPILIDDYILVGAEDCQGGTMAAAGVVIHETGHLLGLPDLYDTTDPQSRGPVGHFDLMSTGNYNRPDSPAQLGAFSRSMLGWLDMHETGDLTGGVEVSLPAVGAGGQVVLVPFQGTDEFLLIEHRTRLGSDQALPGEGLLIWHVDAAAVVERYPSNTLNTVPSHPAVALVQADGRGDLQAGVNRGDAGDVWPGSTGKTHFDGSTNPAARPYESSWAGELSLAGLIIEHGEARFTLSGAEGEVSHRIEPDDLPPLVPGHPWETTFTLNGAASPHEISWSADSIMLATLGLTLDAPTGLLSGTVAESATGGSLTVEARNPQGVLASRTYHLEVLPPVAVSIHDLVAAAMDPNTPLRPEAARYADGLGNQNGRYDLGDLVVMIRSGRIRLAPGDIVRYESVLPSSLLTPR